MNTIRCEPYFLSYYSKVLREPFPQSANKPHHKNQHGGHPSPTGHIYSSKLRARMNPCNYYLYMSCCACTIPSTWSKIPPLSGASPKSDRTPGTNNTHHDPCDDVMYYTKGNLQTPRQQIAPNVTQTQGIQPASLPPRSSPNRDRTPAITRGWKPARRRRPASAPAPPGTASEARPTRRIPPRERRRSRRRRRDRP